jgi:hypothetical protein
MRLDGGLRGRSSGRACLLDRVFEAIEEIYVDQGLPDGDVLAIEFFESVCGTGHERFRRFFRPGNRAWFERDYG